MVVHESEIFVVVWGNHVLVLKADGVVLIGFALRYLKSLVNTLIREIVVRSLDFFYIF